MNLAVLYHWMVRAGMEEFRRKTGIFLNKEEIPAQAAIRRIEGRCGEWDGQPDARTLDGRGNACDNPYTGTALAAYESDDDRNLRVSEGTLNAAKQQEDVL